MPLISWRLTSFRLPSAILATCIMTFMALLMNLFINSLGISMLAMATMVAKHLLLFVGGKLEVAQLGEFCCSSRPLHAPAG